ncbi:MAG TPA: hypothetical protein VN515_03175 [Terriglobales bacterium]|nr:hypothetical protein [Terriglobales bacterium]
MSGGLSLNTVRPVYTLVGDEIFLRDRFRAEMAALVPPDMEEFALFDEDLAATPLDEILDRARTPSLMAPLQIFFVRNAKELFGRGASAAESDTGKESAKKSKRKHGDFPANLERFVSAQKGVTAAVLVFLADHLHLPADRQRMSLEDKGKLQRIEATLGACGSLIPCARVSEATAATLAREMAAARDAELTAPAARLLAEMLEGDLGRIRQEVDKLAAYALPGRQITPEAVTALVAASRVGSSFELAQRLGRGDRAGSLASLERIWADEGDGGAIGLVFQLSRAFKMALILRQEKVRDRSGIYRVLPEGLRPPGFAADAVLGLSRSMPEARLREGIRRLHGADVTLRSQPPTMKGVFEDVIVALTRA